ncbi:MAG: HEPN domain-containing protein [Acidimicrobiia bacterium]|nr:HEPN domain-containing protein [Acidimicrobiia bacterium]
MVAVRAQPTPTLEDARLAADAIKQALDPAQVLLFGSVACGTQNRGSDLDLVLVFDDLGDYADRRLIADRARQTVMGATGFGCDVRVTDRPEWEVRSKRCRSTFEAHIASHAVTLLSRPPRGGIDWKKEIGMAPSDADQAARSINNAVNALTKLLLALEPSTKERDALLAGDRREAESLKRSRLLGVCEQSQTVMETSLKALVHALEGDHPGKVHGVGQLLDAAGEHLPPPAANRLAACLGPISPQDASVWREAGTYPDDMDIAGDPDDATDEFSAQMAKAAADMADCCIDLIKRQLGYLPPAAPQALNRIGQIQQEIPARHPGLDDAGRGPQPDIGL